MTCLGSSGESWLFSWSSQTVIATRASRAKLHLAQADAHLHATGKVCHIRTAHDILTSCQELPRLLFNTACCASHCSSLSSALSSLVPLSDVEAHERRRKNAPKMHVLYRKVGQQHDKHRSLPTKQRLCLAAEAPAQVTLILLDCRWGHSTATWCYAAAPYLCDL